MMSDLLDHLCQLARLNLLDGERDEFSRKFASLLAFVEHIKESSSVPDSAALHVPKERQSLRSDIPKPFSEIKDISGSYAAGHIGDLEENAQ
jgi:aspartyl/glutamyl-tRNA(Asn/Gln) amidotransferase C subunit